MTWDPPRSPAMIAVGEALNRLARRVDDAAWRWAVRSAAARHTPIEHVGEPGARCGGCPGAPTWPCDRLTDVVRRDRQRKERR